MLELNSFIIPIIVFICAYGLFYSSLRIKNQFLKKIFQIRSINSEHKVFQSGGIVFFLTCIALFPLFFYKLPESDLISLMVWGCCTSLSVGYGVLDDKYELRSWFKIGMQLVVLTFFIAFIPFSIKLGGRIFIAIWFSWGFGVFNGINLIDGIDELSAKHITITFAIFAFFSYQASLELPFIFSLVNIALLSAFYLFNRYPSKIHLGESGGAFLSMSLLYTATSLAQVNFDHNAVPNWKSVLTLFMFFHYPMTELGISFLRRVFLKKTPFKRDRGHIHFILLDQYKLSAPKASWIITACHASISIFMVLGIINHFVWPVFLASGAIYALGYIAVIYPHIAKTPNAMSFKDFTLSFFTRRGRGQPTIAENVATISSENKIHNSSEVSDDIDAA